MKAAPGPWVELEEHLANARRSILAEIRSYPPPIAGCDQQFNYLLEQRDQIARDLNRLASIARGDGTALLHFIDTCDCIPRELRARLAQQLHERADSPTVDGRVAGSV